MTKAYNVTIRDRFGALVETRAVKCADHQDPAELAIDEYLDGDEAPEGLCVSSVEEVG